MACCIKLTINGKFPSIITTMATLLNSQSNIKDSMVVTVNSIVTFDGKIYAMDP